MSARPSPSRSPASSPRFLVVHTGHLDGEPPVPGDGVGGHHVEVHLHRWVAVVVGGEDVEPAVTVEVTGACVVATGRVDLRLLEGVRPNVQVDAGLLAFEAEEDVVRPVPVEVDDVGAVRAHVGVEDRRRPGRRRGIGGCGEAGHRASAVRVGDDEEVGSVVAVEVAGRRRPANAPVDRTVRPGPTGAVVLEPAVSVGDVQVAVAVDVDRLPAGARAPVPRRP